MSQENVEAVRGLLAHWATRFALLLSLLAFGALVPVACEDDDDTATAEPEVITSDFGQDPPGRGAVVVAGAPDACGAYRKGPGAIVVRIEVFEGVVRCREARRVLKNYYPHGKTTPPWSCVDYGDELVQCIQPRGAFRGILDCRVARPTEVRAACRDFAGPTPPAEPGEPEIPDPPGAELRRAAGTQVLRSPPGRAAWHRLSHSSGSRWLRAEFRVAWRAACCRPSTATGVRTTPSRPLDPGGAEDRRVCHVP